MSDDQRCESIRTQLTACMGLAARAVHCSDAAESVRHPQCWGWGLWLGGLGLASATPPHRLGTDSEHCRPPRDGSTCTVQTLPSRHPTRTVPKMKTSVKNKIPGLFKRQLGMSPGMGPAPLAGAHLIARSFSACPDGRLGAPHSRTDGAWNHFLAGGGVVVP